MKKLSVFLIFLMMTGCLKQYETDQINVGVPLIHGTAETAKVCTTFKPAEEIRCFKVKDLKDGIIIGLNLKQDAKALNSGDHFALEDAFGGKCAYFSGNGFSLANTVSRDLLRRIYSYKNGFEKLEKDIKLLNQRKYIVRDNTSDLYLKVLGIAASMLIVGYVAGSM